MKTKNYQSPECNVLDIISECVLCASYEDNAFYIDEFEKEQGSWE